VNALADARGETAIGILRPSGSRLERLGEWYVSNHPALLRFAYVVTRDSALAEDLCQEAFVRLYRAGRRAEEEGLGAYARRTIVNLSRSRFRRVKREREVPRQPAHHQEHDAVVERDEVWTAMGDLSTQQRACVALRFYEDLDDRRIAQVLGVTVGTVKTQMHRALRKLRETLGEAEER
jgi:RNA polymerase sigma-70 factor (sigma-E family)